MYTATEVAQDLMRECGKSSTAVQARIVAMIEEVTVDLFSQNECRFKDLETRVQLDIVTTAREYVLPDDFASVMEDAFYELDSAGEISAICNVKTKEDIFRRKSNGLETGYRMGFIRKDGDAYYLVLSDDPDEDTTFEFGYYRRPVGSDVVCIRNVSILKDGVRAKLPDLFEQAANYMAIYLREKSGFLEHAKRFVGEVSTKPSQRVLVHNRMMRKIAEGN